MTAGIKPAAVNSVVNFKFSQYKSKEKSTLLVV